MERSDKPVTALCFLLNFYLHRFVSRLFFAKWRRKEKANKKKRRGRGLRPSTPQAFEKA